MLTPPLLYADLASLRASTTFPFTGVPFDQLAWAIATGVVQWAPSVQLLGVSVGTAGVGTLNVPTTKVLVAPNPPLAIAGLGSAGLLGPLGLALGTVVGQAIPKSISSYGQYSGGVAGVGIGADASKVIFADGSALSALLLPLLIAFMGPGSAAPQMARGLGTAISKLVLTGTGVGSVVGSPSPVGASGVSKSVLV